MSTTNAAHARAARPEPELHTATIPDHASERIRRTLPGFGRRLVRSGGQWLDGDLCQGTSPQPAPGTLPGGRNGPPGTGSPHGSDVGHFGGRGPDGRPRFDQAVPPGGYLWWYLDALSDDERYGITLIAFVGSVFSPYYAWSRRRGQSNPMAHCALNVALYGEIGRWAMTERGAASCSRDRDQFRIGPSLVSCNQQGLHFRIDEVANPLPRSIRGEVFVDMGQAWQPNVFSLTADAAHRWGPLQPHARIQVEFTRPKLSWQGWAYVDSNEGDEPIDQGFSDWDWSRAHLPDGSTAVLYDLRSPGMDAQSSNVLALRFSNGQAPQAFSPGIRQSLGRTGWGLHRQSFQEGKQAARLQSSLEDTPFYARSVIRTTVLGHDVLAMHETLDARRFASAWVQSLLPWRMPRKS